jgi:hypothetical protein
MAKKLEKSIWQPYFDAVSRVLSGKRAEIEVAALDLGDQIEAEWLPLLGITYDPKDDLIEVALEGVDHLIPRPREVWVETEGLDLSSIQVIDSNGVRQIVMLRDPLMLPAPEHARQAE